MLHPFSREKQVRRPAVYRTVAHVTFFFKLNGESVRFGSALLSCMSRLSLLLSVITIVFLWTNRSIIRHDEVVERQSVFDLLWCAKEYHHSYCLLHTSLNSTMLSYALQTDGPSTFQRLNRLRVKDLETYTQLVIQVFSNCLCNIQKCYTNCRVTLVVIWSLRNCVQGKPSY